MKISRWKTRLEMRRKGKDKFFLEDPRSPISLQEREKFEGLNYYPPDQDYRFELELREHEEKKRLRIEATHGEEQEFLRWGEFRFKIGGEECTLQAYKSDPGEGRLFVSFRDATSGAETYGAGRYLDLEPPIHRTAGGKWILDFNEAYNPWCAYSEAYACPFVPPENWLKVPVRAGEKSYPPKKE